MKLKNIILVIVFTLFTIQPTKVESSDIVSDILGTALEQGKKYKQEREKWGIPKNDLAGLKSKDSKPTFAQNLKFFFTYQVGWSYIRYFMWNFAGRQNDIQNMDQNMEV